MYAGGTEKVGGQEAYICVTESASDVLVRVRVRQEASVSGKLFWD